MIFYKILSSNIIPLLKTGDLIFFSDNIKIPINIIAGNNYFSHSGIIVIIDNIPYVYEIVDVNIGYATHQDFKPFKKAIQLTPFVDRVKYFSGHCYIASLIKPLKQEQIDKLNKFIENDYHYKFVDFNKWAPFIVTRMKLKSERFCHEFTADILDQIDISSEPIKQKKYNITDSVVNLCDGSIYSQPIQIIPDELLLKNNIYTIHNLPKLTFCTKFVSNKLLNKH